MTKNKKLTCFYQFTAHGQTAVNYVNPGANPSVILGTIKGSSDYIGNVLLFNPNGITIGTGSSVTNLNSFFASTNQFNGVSDNNILFKEPTNTNALTVNGLNMSNVKNAHFVAPGVIFNATGANPTNSLSIRAIGGGSYDSVSNTFSNETAVNNPVLETNKYIIDMGGSIKSNNITVESKTNYAGGTNTIFRGDVEATTIVADNSKTGSVYLLAKNCSASGNAGAQIYINGKINGESAKVTAKADRIVLNGDIDVSGTNGGSIDIDVASLDQYGDIKAIGNEGKGGNIDIYTTEYVATSGTATNASGKTQGGNISIQGDYQILSSGSYDVSSSAGKGGNIKISAFLTKLFGVNIDASGYSAGGNVYVGGAGTTNESIVDSYMTILSDAGIINANSEIGKGGNVYINSLGNTYVFGKINTVGSGKENSGGYIELCGEKYLGTNYDINVGIGGSIYLDPKNIIITDSQTGAISFDALLSSGSTFQGRFGLNNQDYFGSAVALTNGLLAIGAMNQGISHPGSVYLLSFTPNTDYSNLVLNVKLANGSVINGTTLAVEDYFGSALALYNPTSSAHPGLLAIGAEGTSSSATGGVYLFSFTGNSNYSNLKLETTINNSTPVYRTGSATSTTLGLSGGDLFGSALAISVYNDSTVLLAVGAKGDTSNTGAAYLFSCPTSTATPYGNMTIAYKAGNCTPPTNYDYYNISTIEAKDEFGSSVALLNPSSSSTGNYGLLAVGAPADPAPATPAKSGGVYLFTFDKSTSYTNLNLARTLTETLSAYTLQKGDNFGSALALASLSNNTTGLLAIGAYGIDSKKGRVFLYSLDYTSTGSATSPYDTLAWVNTQSNPAAASGTYFGNSAALTNQLLAVGSYYNNTGYPNTGAVYLYSFDVDTAYTNIGLDKTLDYNSSITIAAPLSVGDKAGSSVAIYDDTNILNTYGLLAIGAPGDSNDTGAVYLYYFNKGTNYTGLYLYDKLVDGSSINATQMLNLADGDKFGSSLAITNGLLAIGASGTGTGGAAYIISFTNNATSPYSTMYLQTEITSAGAYTLSSFGDSVALYNNLLAIGDSTATVNAKSNCGALYLYHFTGTDYANPVLDTRLTDGSTLSVGSLTLSDGDNFGKSVALYSNQLAVGAPGTGTGGAAYLFSFSGTSAAPYTSITKETEITSVGSHTLSSFGDSIALYDDVLAVGDATATVNSKSNCGAVYLFLIANSNYSNPIYNLLLTDGSIIANTAGGTYTFNLAANDNFGSAVALYDTLLAIGSSGYSAGAERGAAYLLHLVDEVPASYTFTSQPSDTVYLSPGRLAAWLETSTLVNLQANNDITFLSSVTVSGGSGHELRLQAGRNITINDNLAINLGSANLNATANEKASDTTLVQADRDPGIATLTMNTGSSIVTNGSVTLTMKNGEGKTNKDNGNIVTRTITASEIDIFNEGNSVSPSDPNVIIYGPLTANNLTGTSDIASNGYIDFQNSALSEFKGNLTLNTIGGAISQITTGGGISVTGTTTIGSVSGNVTLNNDLNDFKSTVTITSANDAIINDQTSLAMGSVNVSNDLTLHAGAGTSHSGNIIMDTTSVGRNLSLTATSGNITQNTNTGHAITLTAPTGTTSLTATGNGTTTGNINLNNVENDFTSTITSNSSGYTTIDDATSLTMGTVGTGKDLTLIAGNSGSGNITLKGTSVGEDLILTAKNGNISQSTASGEAVVVTKTTTLTGGTGSTNYINLNSTYNALTETVSIVSAYDANIKNTIALWMGDCDVNHNLSIQSNISINQTSGTIIDVSNNTYVSTPGAVSLAQPDNDFCSSEADDAQVYIYNGDKTAAAASAIITDTDSIKFGDVNVTGAFTVNAGGNISQCGGTAIIVGGNATFNTTGSINLGNSGNSFGTSTSSQLYLTGLNSEITTSNNLYLGDVDLSGYFTVDAQGSISQCSGTKVLVDGITKLTASSGGVAQNITLNNTGNDFGGYVKIISGNDVKLSDIGTFTFGGGTSTISGLLELTASGKISQNLTTDTLLVTGTTALTAGSTNNIDLSNTTNNFVGAVSIASAYDAYIRDTNNLTMGSVNVNHNLTLTAGAGGSGNLKMDTTSVGNNMTLTSTGGNIEQFLTSGHAITVNGTSTLTAGTGGLNYIDLTNHENDFKNTVTASAGNSVNIYDANNLAMGTVSAGTYLNLYAGWSGNGNLSMDTTTVGSDMDITAQGGNLTQSGDAGHGITVNGRSTITATGGTTTGNITLTNADNDFIGRVALSSSETSRLRDTNSLIMDTSSIGNNLYLTAAGNITQYGTTILSVFNDTHLYAANSAGVTQYDVLFGSNDNRFGTNTTGQVYIDLARDANIKGYDGVDTLRMGTSDVRRNMELISTGNIIQCSPTTITVAGTTSLSAGSGKDITLNEATNDFVGNVLITSGNNVNIADANTLNFGASTISGTFDASAGQDININDTINATGNTTFIANGSIGINDDITVSNGDFTATANNGAHTGTANFTMASGTNINTANGNISITIPDNAGAGTITLSNLLGETITAWNKSLTAGTDVVINGGSTITETSTTAANPLILSSDGGNFTNNAGTGALVTTGDRRWLIYTGSPAATTLNGLVPVNTYYSSTIYTVPPATVAAGNSVLYRTPAPPGPTPGPGGIVAGGVVGGAAGAGALAASLSPLLLAGLGPNSVLAASPLYLLETPLVTGAAAPITGAAAPIAEDAKKYQFYYDENRNIIIWADSGKTPPGPPGNK